MYVAGHERPAMPNRVTMRCPLNQVRDDTLLAMGWGSQWVWESSPF